MIKNILLIILSTLLTILSIDIILGLVGFKSFNSYIQRYKIDNKKSYVIGYFKNDKNLPQVLKRNFNHKLEDISSNPIGWNVTTDKYGYRNINVMKTYDKVFVGDSVAFGFGVDNNEIFSKLYSNKVNESIYNLAIPNVGPASYMYMIERFLSKQETKEFFIFLYLGNDIANLNSAYWNDMFKKKAPNIKSRIYRSDVPLHIQNIPLFIVNNRILYNSKLFHMIWNVYSKNLKNDESLSKILKIENKTHVSKCKKFDKYKAEIEKILIEISMKIKSHKELNNDINSINNNLSGENISILYETINLFVKKLIKLNILPIGEDKRSLINKLSSLNFFYYNCNKINGISKLKFINNISNKDKLNIFYKYILSLNKRGYKTTLVLLPTEYRIKNGYDSRIANNLTLDMQKKGINVINTTFYFNKYYINSKNNSLFLDGAHLNRDGHKFLTNILIKEIK